MIRFFDILIASTAFLVLWPLFLLVALLIRGSSRAPVIYAQTRIGREMRPFTIYKFRTIKGDQAEQPVLGTSDKRMTSLGMLLRKSKIDELPQLWNILKGDMSVVGPRPQMPFLVEKYKSDFSRSLSVKPGLFSPAALKYRNESRLFDEAEDPLYLYEFVLLPDKLSMDIELANGFGLTKYLCHLFKALWTLLTLRFWLPISIKTKDSKTEQVGTQL